ncbi:uncharacterized protein LOC123529998 [Mercenaria mercenaria]|uniref:uncharacterized protein LOC123529998 n=1 Tax=Mercenaria mercenaria TaxID=6596 RepID=UPI00234F8D8F|nr:uncharacterized protein LOC123529998 [Mercenaria mercenaria]
MKIFEALLVKACVPLSFILLVLWSHDGAHDKTTVNVLFTLVITYTWWWLFAGHKRANRSYDTNSLGHSRELLNVMFIANFIVIYRVLGNEHQRRFIIDHAIPFMDLISVYNCIKHELLCVLYFSYNYARYVGITPSKGIILLVYLFIHAVFLLVILEFLLTTTVASVHIFLTENFLYRYDANLTKDYPMGFVDVIELYKDENYPAYVKEIFVQNMEGKFTLQTSTKEIHKDSSGSYLPYNNRSVFRYIGEDVEISCSYLYNNSTAFRTIWIKNGKQLAKSNRYIFNLNISRDTSNESKQWYSVNLMFRISLLSKYDFGKYECVLVTSEILQTTNLYQNKMIKKMLIISVYHIEELTPQTKIMYREVGSLILSVGYFYYHMFENDDISVEYTINNRPIREVCGGYITQVCSVGSRLRRLFATRNINSITDEGLPEISAYSYDGLDIYSTLVKFCMCKNGYGIHRVLFHRRVYLKSKNTHKILEFQHPYAVVMLPHTRMSLFRYFDDEYLYKDIEKHILNGTDLDIIERKINELLNFISANEEKVFSIANLVQSLVSLTILFIFNLLLSMFINLYFRWFIKFPVRRYIYQPLPCNQPQLHIAYQEYDLIVSHSDADLFFVSSVLVPFLENECHLHVCLPDRDFHPGKSIFRLYADAFSKSRKIIVVLSSGYLGDTQCSDLQLEHLIMPMLYEGRKGKHDVLFIKYDDRCRLPEPLRWNFDIDVLPWTVETQTVLKLKRIKLWYLTGNI